MDSKESLEELRRRREAWEERAGRGPRRDAPFTTLSHLPVETVYTPLDLEGFSYQDELSLPGEYPFTRGIHRTMYRGRLWTMRMFSGFGSAEETNERYRYLLAHGQTGLSVAFDLPTLYGYDTDAPQFPGEFGHCGVGVTSLADMELLFDSIPLDQVTTSMTINSPAAVLWAMYIAVAEKQGVPLEKLGGTIQNDILKEYIAQKEYIFPPEPSMRLVVDTIEFGARHLPRWNPISISGYHIREAGSTAVQELAFTLADGFAYVDACLQRGLEIDAFAPRLSFFFNAHNDFFEEICKYRAARRIWAREMRQRYGARRERSWWMRFHTQTAGVSLTAQEAYNNVVRVAIQALAAVLGGTQSLHTNALDEALALPSEETVRIALRTQQILAHESGVANTVDPLGGSFFVESLTHRMEDQARQYFHRIGELGGMVRAIELGYPQREIAESAWTYQRQVDTKEQIIVGLNEFVSQEPEPVPILRISPESERRHQERLERVRRERDGRAALSALRDLEAAARSDSNLMPPILEAVKAYCTLGEICDALREVFGVYQEEAVI